MVGDYCQGMAILANPRTPFEARLEVHERSFERGCDNIIIPLKYAMMIYCIIKKMVVNLGAIIRNSIFSLMKEPIVVVSFPYIIEALCLKAISELLAFLQAPIPGDVCSQATLNQTLMLHQNR